MTHPCSSASPESPGLLGGSVAGHLPQNPRCCFSDSPQTLALVSFGTLFLYYPLTFAPLNQKV